MWSKKNKNDDALLTWVRYKNFRKTDYFVKLFLLINLISNSR